MSQEGGGGGHGGNWIVTYADMITLLMAGFIVIVTFGSRESDQNIKREDSISGGKGSKKVVGTPRKGVANDSVAIRSAQGMGDPFGQGSRTPPMYAESPQEVLKNIQAAQDENPGKLSDSFEISYPLGFVFESGVTFSQGGQTQLLRIAKQMKNLPFDMLVLVGDQEEMPQAVAIYRFLFQRCEIVPSRLGLGLKPDTVQRGRVWLILRRQPTPSSRRTKGGRRCS